ncbi:MAG: FAD-binding oxidoreductase [Candidatus Gastranaerophilales bacterium]|nr:FAD-binding oxidoreductase [Candidatus Gastranaerophilales bacterium]
MKNQLMLKNKIKKIYKATIVKRERVSVNSYYIEIECDKPVEAKAGQFISIYCNNLTLRRPFSVFSNNEGKIGILFKERGKGTAYIKSLNTGDFIDIIGPLGNGFNIKNKKSLLIGAGIGAAPVAFLKSKLDKENIENLFISGFLTRNEIPDCITVNKIYTDDGSIGEKGSILDYVEEHILNYKPQIMYTCAPYIVLKSIAQLGIKYNIETQTAMEKVMACGIGVCRGCVIDIMKDGKIQNAAVCKDGPVFSGNEVIWQ